MMATKKNKTTFQRPNFSISKINQEKGTQLYTNFFNACKNNLTKNAKVFATFAVIKRLINRSKVDPTKDFIVEVIKRLEKDKINSEIAMQIAELGQSQAQSLQKIALIRMIPYFLGLLGIIVLTALSLSVRPLAFNNPELLKFIIPMFLFIPLFVWGIRKRKEIKFDLLAANVVLQAASAYASAKMQGKGTIAAMQNLEEMRRRAKSIQDKEANKKKEKK